MKWTRREVFPAAKAAAMQPSVGSISASSQVLHTTELVLLILEHLDERSLVRSESITRTFNDSFYRTKALRYRVSFVEDDRNVINVTLEDSNPDLVRNPLLDWFTTRTFNLEGVLDGPINQCHDFVLFNILPHALRAVRSRASSVHKISITNLPIDRVHLYIVPKDIPEGFPWTHMPEVPAIELIREGGVTIGDVLQVWVKLSKSRKRMLVAIHIPFPGPLKYSTFWAPSPLCPGMDDPERMFRAAIYFTMRMLAIINQRPNAPKGGLLRNRAAWGRVEVMSDFYNMCGTRSWFKISMEKQTRVLADLMEARKLYANHDWRVQEYPAWPAMAWKADCNDNKVQYTVDYAAGLNFTRYKSVPMDWEASQNKNGRIMVTRVMDDPRSASQLSMEHVHQAIREGLKPVLWKGRAKQ